MHLKEAIEQIPGIDFTGKPDAEIRGISYDSRTVREGDLFVAIKGAKADGALFVKQAVERGAWAVASEQKMDLAPHTASLTVPDARKFLAQIARIFFQDPGAKLNLVGITGTNGKTTTSYLMDSVYGQAGIRSCLAGTLGMKIGTRRLPSEHTTPEAPDLMAFLSQAIAEGCTHGALEVSSHSLVLNRVFGTRFAVGVFMNLTRDHLDFHRDMESYFQAKKQLFAPENGNRVETAVINTDDAYGRRLKDEITCPVMRFALSPPADIYVLEHENRADGTGLAIATPKGKARFDLRLIGQPNIYNVMAATGASLVQGIGLEDIRRGIEGLKGVPGRLELVDAGQDFTVVVDYAHSPDALENLLKTVSRLPHERIITVFGCGGDRDRTKRPLMGAVAARLSDVVVVTSDNPRSEDPAAIIEEVKRGIVLPADRARQAEPPRNGRFAGSGRVPRLMTIVDRRAAIERAIGAAGAGDVVLVAGKGHEKYQEVGDKVLPFDDVVVARAALLRRRGGAAPGAAV